MSVLECVRLVDEGFATDLVVTATGGIPAIAELEGTFRLVSNMTNLRQEVPVPQRFIDGGFLSDDFVERLSPSTVDPRRKSYFVPAGAPYLDGTPDDPPSNYIVMMGHGALTLIDTFRIPGSFRIKIETNGPVIPIDAHLDLGPLGNATVFGKAELRLSGLTAGLSVEMDAPLLRSAGLDFDADAEIGVNTEQPGSHDHVGRESQCTADRDSPEKQLLPFWRADERQCAGDLGQAVRHEGRDAAGNRPQWARHVRHGRSHRGRGSGSGGSSGHRGLLHHERRRRRGHRPVHLIG
ncbi:MAG UNVERIFIED_CONTAM: hypothetical protein LVR18_51645 [Planctomycetaceae bacterium]